MDLKEAIVKRHSVRSYLDKPIEGETLEKLNAMIDECNREGDLHIQLVLNEPKAFDCFLAHYGKFKGANNYIALVGKDCKDFDEKMGYYGRKSFFMRKLSNLILVGFISPTKRLKTLMCLI